MDYNQNGLYEEMYREAEQTKKNVIVRKLETAPKIKRLVAQYKGSKGDVSVIVESFENTKYVSFPAGPDTTVENVKVHNKEALYYVQKLKTGKAAKYIQFFKDDTNQLYEVRTTSPELTKEDLLVIADKLK